MNILITGGASGLGEAITRKLSLNKENRIYFTYNKSVDKAKQIENDFSNATGLKIDFTITEEVSFLIETVNKISLDALVNNAYTGDAIKTHFHKMAQDDFLSAFTGNILPAVAITQAAISQFRKKKNGRIITILTSFLLNAPPAGAAAYVATKAYLQSLVKSWAAENIKFNITSNSISPSFMQTGLTNNVDSRVIEQLVNEHPYKQLLVIAEVAEVISFMLTNASKHINGIDIPMNAATNIK